MDTTENKQSDTKGACCETSVMHSSRVQGSLTLVFILLAAFLFAQTINALKEYRYIGGGVAPSNAITVTGEGEVFAVPDTAEFTFSVREEGATAGEVDDLASVKAGAIIDVLKERGVEEKDIKTISYNLQPTYEWQPATCPTWERGCTRTRVQTGFALDQSVRVKVRELDAAGELLGLVAEKEASNVSSLAFTIADEDGERAEARKMAIDEAKEKAEKLAADLGVQLVRIVGFYEDGVRPVVPMMRVAMMDEEAGFGGDMQAVTSLPAGENQIISRVNITYEIR